MVDYTQVSKGTMVYLTSQDPQIWMLNCSLLVLDSRFITTDEFRLFLNSDTKQ